MGTHTRLPGQVETNRYLTAADYFLRNRNFADCRSYALRARDSDPTHPGPTRILAIATALSARTISSTRHDYYAVLGLAPFEPDASRISSSFRTLATNLNQNVNTYPLAAEALDLVLRAWSVLSNPIEKARFDEELRRSLAAAGGSGGGCMSGNDGGTFWTMCPYCYYVYEYDSVYEDCCLRCSNGKCRRVLHALAIRGSPPPPDVVEKGQYWCAGFMPFGICGSNGEEIEEKVWGPFEPPPVGLDSKGCKQNVACNGEEGIVVDISEDEKAGTGFQYHGNGKRAKIKAEDSNGGEMKDSNGEGVIIGNGFMENNVKEVKIRRKNSVLLKKKKFMGRGLMIDENQASLIYGVGEDDNFDVNENVDDGLDNGPGGEVSNDVESGVEFFEGDDDVLIGLQCGFDVGNGDMTL